MVKVPQVSESAASEGARAEGAAPSLDIKASNRTFASAWTIQQKKVRRATADRLNYWQSHGYQCLWVTLTSAPDSPVELRDSFKELRRRLDRQLGFRIEYVCVETSEGHGVLHMVWAWRDADQSRKASFYVSQEWLSDTWDSIHGARSVWVSRIRKSAGDRRRLSRYIVSQYCGGQDALVRLSQSRCLVALSRMRKALFKALFESEGRAAEVPDYDGMNMVTKGRLMNKWLFCQYRRAWDELVSSGKCFAFGDVWVWFCGSVESV